MDQGSPGRVSPQNGHVPPSSLLTTSSSVSSLSSSTVWDWRGGGLLGRVGVCACGCPLSSTPLTLSPPTPQLSGSLMSLYSEGELGSVAVRGCVQFSLRYEPAKKELQVHVLRCRELAEAKKQRSDP